KIGVIYPDDAFGSAVLDGVKSALTEHGSQPVAVGSYPRQTAQADAAIQTVRAASPDAVVIVGPANTVAPIIKMAHVRGWSPLFVTVSFVGTDDLIKLAGQDVEGMVITQVVPPYYLTDLRTVALYRRTLSRFAPGEAPNFVSLEGFVDAMVMVEGIKRAGKELTREGLIRGIESLHDFDIELGTQLKLNYSARDHKGFEHVIPSVVRGGRAVPFTDWSTPAPRYFFKVSRRIHLLDGGFGLVESVIRRTHERAGFDVLEAHLFTGHLVFAKFVGMNVADDWQMFARRLQVLAERQDVSALLGEFVHRAEHFTLLFAEPEHQPGFGRNVWMRLLGTP